ncbi:MAG TPA: hypothetical protein VK174_15530 [Chitinophagales bacterium]|nr:hypothetical protein [Chitinophagales bacterium]
MFLAITLAITIAGGKWKKHTVLKSDAAGYYVYLPSVFIYNDLLGCRFYPYVDSVYNPGDGVVYYAIQQSPETRNMYFKYNYGVAAFEMPFFLLTHVFVKFTGCYPADGYSAPYQLAVALNAVLFAFLGLLVLRKFLLFWFNEVSVALTLLVIAFGTNYLAQVITQPGLSHVYMFFLHAVVLYSTQQLYATGRPGYLLMLAAALAMVLVTRSSGIFIIIFPLLWKAGGNGVLYLANFLWIRYKPLVATAISIGIAICMVQLLYWKLTTGHWYFYTYRREYFDFANPEILKGLFSYRKGWFLYTPLALLGFAGLFFVKRRSELRIYLLPFALYFMVTFYVVFSWWQWYYGGSFGSRVMVESLAVLALPIAAFSEFVVKASGLVRFASGLLISFFVLLNVFQTGQYAKGIIHWQKMNKDYYWRVFGKMEVTDADKELLKTTEELNTNNSPIK